MVFLRNWLKFWLNSLRKRQGKSIRGIIDHIVKPASEEFADDQDLQNAAINILNEGLRLLSKVA